MSAYKEHPTTLTDALCLTVALKAMGYVIERYDEPQTLYDYHGHERPQKANVIIRREFTGIGASNDIGFLKGADGTFTAIISAYDRNVKFNDAWMGEVKQAYSEQREIAMARRKGYIFQGREVIDTNKGHQVRLVFAAR